MNIEEHSLWFQQEKEKVIHSEVSYSNLPTIFFLNKDFFRDQLYSNQSLVCKSFNQSLTFWKEGHVWIHLPLVSHVRERNTQMQSPFKLPCSEKQIKASSLTILSQLDGEQNWEASVEFSMQGHTPRYGDSFLRI